MSRADQMDCPAAAHRLALGIPATVEHGHAAHGSSAVQAHVVAETTQSFITLMDALKLKMHAKDQLHPLLSDVLTAYTKARGQDGVHRERLLQWLIKLNALHASDELDEGAAREVRARAYQMLFDSEQAYTAWFKSLEA